MMQLFRSCCFAPGNRFRGLVMGRDSAARGQIVMIMVTVLSQVDAAGIPARVMAKHWQIEHWHIEAEVHRM